MYVRRPLYFAVVCAFPLWHRTTNLRRPRDTRQKYTRGLIVGRAAKIHLDIHPLFLPKFYSAKFCLNFRYQSHLTSSSSEMEQLTSEIGNIHLDRLLQTLLLIRTENFAQHPPPLLIFYRTSKVRNLTWIYPLRRISSEMKQHTWYLKQT